MFVRNWFVTMDREIKAFNELNELIDREKRLARLSTSSEIELRDDLRLVHNSSPILEGLSHHKFIFKCPCPAKNRKYPWIRKGGYFNVKVPCMIGHMFREHTYIDLKAPMNFMSRLYYNWIMSNELNPRQDPYDPNQMCNFVGLASGLHVFIGDFVYQCDFVILEDIRGIIDPYLGEIVLGEPFIRTSQAIYDKDEGSVTFSSEIGCIKYLMPHNVSRFSKFEPKFKGIKGLDVDNIPALEVDNNNQGRARVKYSMCLALGPEYKWDERVIQSFKTIFFMQNGKT